MYEQKGWSTEVLPVPSKTGVPRATVLDHGSATRILGFLSFREQGIGVGLCTSYRMEIGLLPCFPAPIHHFIDPPPPKAVILTIGTLTGFPPRPRWGWGGLMTVDLPALFGIMVSNLLASLCHTGRRRESWATHSIHCDM